MRKTVGGRFAPWRCWRPIAAYLAKLVHPNVVGPARRAAAAAGNAVGAPGVEQRIENREQRRDIRQSDVNPNAAARANARADGAVADPISGAIGITTTNGGTIRLKTSGCITTTTRGQIMIATRMSCPEANVTPWVFAVGCTRISTPNTPWPPVRMVRQQRPYSNGTPAGNTGSNLGADIGGAANVLRENTGAAIGGAIGNAIGAGRAAEQNAVGNPVPRPGTNSPVPGTGPAPAQPSGGDSPACIESLRVLILIDFHGANFKLRRGMLLRG